MATLRARIRRVARLAPAVRDAMWRVFEAYYDDVQRPRFEADLAPKSHVILLYDREDGALQGFSTVQVLRRRIEGRDVVVIYSGDTIIAEGYWGQTALQRAFLRFVMGVKARHPLTRVYWFLISKGYRTYLLLARNFPEHWPRHDRATPPWQASVLDEVAREMFGDDYHPALGVLRHAYPLGRLRQGVAPVGAEELAHPDIRFFVERNPGHHRGDELCCLGRVGPDLWRAYMGKLARRALAARRA